MEEKTLQTTVSQYYNRIPQAVRVSVAATFIIGIICNLFIFTNKAVNHDDIMAEFIYNKSLDISSGRFMWLLIRKVTTYYDMPMFFGITGMACLALAAGIIVYMLNIKDTLFVLLLSGIIGTFPINACYYSYLSISPIYYFAILTAVAGVFMVERCKKYMGMIISGLFIMMSLGTYQSFLALTIGLVFIMAHVELLKNETDIKRWFMKYLRYAVSAGLGYAFYYAATKIVLKVTEEELRAYAGTDKMFSLDFIEILKSFKRSYINQYEFYFTQQAVSSRGFVWLNWLVLGIIAATVIIQIIALFRSGKWQKAAVALLLTLLSPVLINFIYVMMNGKSPAHMLMKYAQILLYIWMIALVCNSGFSCRVRNRINIKYILQTAACVGCAGIIYYGALTSNQLYLRMYYNTQAIDSLCTGLLTRVSVEDDFSTDEPIYFANFTTFFNENYITTATFTQDLHPYVWMGTDIYEGWYSSGHLIRYMDFNHHIKLIASNNRQKENEVKATEEFKNMPCWPDGGSVRRIDGLLTIKFAND